MVGIIIAAIVGILVGVIAGIAYRKNVAEKEIGSAEEEAKRIINDSIKAAESKKREAVLEAKEEIHKSRADLEREIKERRSEVQKTERRLTQKEETLDRKTDAAEQKNEELTRRLAKVQKSQEEAEQYKQQQLERLESISGLTREEAKDFLVNSIEQEAQHDAAIKLRDIQQRTRDEAEQYAREMISSAIQRCAADHVAEATVSVVPLPNDEMKGRIIGREGRNIRTLETLTGVDLIIDDTPEAITLSCFDPVRREIARLTLEKLIIDGRIHPARIEEMVEKSRREVEQTIKQEGERAVLETGVHGLHPELVKLLGRMRYRTSYGQNVLQHSIEVSHIAGILAAELGVDATQAKRAGLLHDIGKAVDREMEGSHVDIGVDLCKRYREHNDIIHAVQAHHGDIEPKTIVACLVQAADAISAARPGARRENLEAYIKRLEKLEEIANTTSGVSSSYAIQAGREIRIIVNPEQVSDSKMVLLSREIAKKIETELEYPGQIKINMIRETRAVEYAK
ncbi:ribonuclease Y [Butyricicoccus porcorum]|uniref:Ribonuclease Y n=1 Tax=Butyricicoccus porcorum TaxID=1945634 RepID=A0A252F3U5_9FIRM|nr:ribonuclease Y [Butyricicoccus porcorum]MDY4483438.1 ribonuclease Y [Butyricicoccus porcorum]OUM20465.1 ribonuclease Y [Butyricicoccus porcorum]